MLIVIDRNIEFFAGQISYFIIHEGPELVWLIKSSFISFFDSRRDSYDKISLGDAEETEGIFNNCKQLWDYCKIVCVKNKSMK